MQNDARNKNLVFATKYSQMTNEQLEDEFEDLKEKIEKMTTNP